MKTPVAFIIFNRPDTTEKVFAEIAKARPPRLFVIADGPRADQPDDREKCAAARAIIDRLDWDCEVLKNYSDVNLGCGQRPASGISWLFEHVEEAIILEDDCVPHPTFFRFCEEMLEKYRNDERVMTVTGRNGLAGRMRQRPYSYHFRRTFSCWGWATWRRAWQHFDIEIKLWPELRNTSWLQGVLGDHRGAEHWQEIFDRAYAGAGEVDYWDFQWAFTCWINYSLAAVADVNLINNIGAGPSATHTRAPIDAIEHNHGSGMIFPLRHPPHMVRDKDSEKLLFDALTLNKKNCTSFYKRLLRKVNAGVKRTAASSGWSSREGKNI